ncbi:MAG: peptidase S8 [Deltaproteobacteria bacterium]|nr:MAG: peptidase S8 [Deltaproteobacteria bacterium]
MSRTCLTLFVFVLATAITACAGGESDTRDEGVAINPAGLAGPPAGAPVGDRYIVELADDAGGAVALAGAGADVVLALPSHHAVAALIPAQALPGLRQNPNIASIEPDPLRQPYAESVPYGISMVQADLFTSDAADGGVTVCIIDSGYYGAHEDLRDNANVTYAPDGGAGDPWVDGCGHGTHVAGTISAAANGLGVVGVNKDHALSLHIVRVFGDDCVWAYASDLVSALDACRAVSGKVVVSMSLGGSFSSRFEQKAFDQAAAAGVLSIAAAGNDGNTRKSYPASYGSVVSVAAIDADKQVASFSQQNSAVELAAPGVGVLSTVPWFTDARVAVGGFTSLGTPIELAALSDGVTGTLVHGGLCDAVDSGWAGAVVLCDRGAVSFYDKVHNAELGGAVGVVIANNVPGGFAGTLGAGNTSAIPAIGVSMEDGGAMNPALLGSSATLVSSFTQPASGYEPWDGTSMATPHVSGVAALVWNHFPSASASDLRDALVATAEDLGPLGRDNAYGYGLVQAQAAYDYLVAGPSCTPTETIEASCNDGVDNDCDGLTDAADSDCDSGGGGSCGARGDACTANADCCSNSCKGKAGTQTCR